MSSPFLVALALSSQETNVSSIVINPKLLKLKKTEYNSITVYYIFNIEY